MKNAMIVAFAMMSLALTNCGRANFGTNDSTLSSKGVVDGVIDPAATQEQEQENEIENGDDTKKVPPTIDDVLADAAVLAQAAKDFDCCLKHGQSKGIEVCNTGMDTCMKPEDIKLNAAMLVNAKIGRCGR